MSLKLFEVFGLTQFVGTIPGLLNFSNALMGPSIHQFESTEVKQSQNMFRKNGKLEWNGIKSHTFEVGTVYKPSHFRSSI